MATDGERLDAGTLREVAKWHEEQAELWEGECRAEVSQHLDEATRLRAIATEAAALPPRLSDWIRACEGTGLGEPHWSGERWDDSGQIVAWFRPDMGVVMLIDGDAAPTAAVVTADPRESNGDTYYTPAELRACLVRLAGERT